jgi:hypothetical protein
VVPPFLAAVTLTLLVAGPGLSATAAVPAGGGWEELDRVIAEVNGGPILLSDLLLEKEFGLLEGVGGSTDLENLSRSYLRRRMILEEIREFGGFSVSSAEVQGAWSGYLSRYPDPDQFDRLLSRWRVAREEISRRLTEALSASLYTENRVRFFVQVLPSEIEAAYVADPARFGGKTLEEAWGALRDELTARAFEREVERWMGNLRDRYRVVVFDWPEKKPQ